MNDRRVVITGLGALTPVGKNVETFWTSLKNGVSGVRPIESFDTSSFACTIGGEVRDFDPTRYFKNPKDVRRVDRFAQLALAAASMALHDSGMELAKVRRDRFGVIVSSGIGGFRALQKQQTVLTSKRPSRHSPFTIPMLIGNMASGLISIEFGLQGPNLCIATAGATSNNSIGEAWRMIKFGDADIFLAGGSEAPIIPVGLAGFQAMRVLSRRNDEPQRASRPFDRDRDGFVMSEGAGVVVLEELEHARTRGAKIYCELAGYGLSSDACHMTAPAAGGEGSARAMRMALKHARLSPSQVDYINAHATSSRLADLSETRAIKSVFGQDAYKVRISATKSMTGHLLGGAGAVELAACVLSIRDSVIPPTINLDHPDNECDLDYTPHTAREMSVRVALSNSSGFGGHNACLVVQAFQR